MKSRTLSIFLALTLPLFTLAEIKEPETIAAEAKSQAKHLTAEAFLEKQEKHPDFLLIDVRTKEEFLAGHIDGAVSISRGTLEYKIQETTTDPDRLIVVYCRTGGRGSLSALTLESIGYKNVYDLEGGFDAWTQAGHPFVNIHGTVSIVKSEKAVE